MHQLPDYPLTWEGVVCNVREVKRIERIDFIEKELVGALDVDDCSALEKLYCYDKLLTTLEVSNCVDLPQLEYDPGVASNWVV